MAWSIPSRRQLIVTAIVAGACWGFVAPASAAETPVTECDRLAANPDDVQKPDGIEGVLALARLDADAAVAACQEAVARYPDTPRFKYQLGRAVLVQHSREVKKWDCKPALPWFEAAATEGHAEAAAAIAHCYGMDWGIEGEAGTAVEWHRKGADLGGATSRATIAIYIGYGSNGYEQDRDQALSILWELAEQGNTKALFRLSDQYRHGFWVKKNPVCARELLRRAAERGDPTSQHLMAKEYLEGRLGTPRDVRKAYEFMALAAQGGHPFARDELIDVERLVAAEPEARLPHGKTTGNGQRRPFKLGQSSCRNGTFGRM